MPAHGELPVESMATACYLGTECKRGTCPDCCGCEACVGRREICYPHIVKESDPRRCIRCGAHLPVF